MRSSKARWMSRTLTSPSRQVSSMTCRSSVPRAKQAISRGRRNPRKRNREFFMLRGIVCLEPVGCQYVETVVYRITRLDKIYMKILNHLVILYNDFLTHLALTRY